MKHHFTLLLFFVAATTYSQQFIKINNTGQLKLLGSFDRELLNEEPFCQWFNPNYDTFEISTPISKLKVQLKNVDSIQIFLGTWCGDSKREVPRFLKLLESADFDRYQLIGLDNTFQNYKQSPFGEEVGLNIHRVPTFIFYQDSIEINRIVESPKTILEKDMMELLTGNYEPNCQIVHELNELFKIHGYEYVASQIDELALAWKDKVENKYVLNTYGFKLFTSFSMAEAEVVFQLNCLLYPNQCSSYYSLGRYYLRLGEKELARVEFAKGLQIDPTDKDLLEALNGL
ncbi:MAG: hypothetical protein RLO81_15745 [Fulvivirga sp.]|uniref:hypothetical protein n=1 Tax=Fulvivirga sp. TaxID=1931237 RepID=UPI0032EB7D83